MSRLIDADVVLAGIDQIWDANPTENPYTDFGQALDSVSEIVEMAPTVDPAQQESTLMVEKLEVGNGSIDMSLSGTPARFFMAGLVSLFKHSGAENFLVLTVSDKETNYAITIQDSKKSVTPAQKLAELAARAEKAEAERDQLKATIDPVKHGRWIDFRAHDKDWLRDDGKTVFMECSVCHEKLCRNLMLSVNYCPSCGCKMMEGEDGKE